MHSDNEFLFIVLHSATTTIITDNTSISFVCVAVGYPTAKLSFWTTGTGFNVSEMEYSAQAETHTFNTMLRSTLVVHDIAECQQAKGYTCSYSNGNLLRDELFFHCPPGRKLNQSKCIFLMFLKF